MSRLTSAGSSISRYFEGSDPGVVESAVDASRAPASARRRARRGAEAVDELPRWRWRALACRRVARPGRPEAGAGAQAAGAGLCASPRLALSGSPADCSGASAKPEGSPSQQPSLSLQRGHCQVPCTQAISAAQRQHRSTAICLSSLDNRPDRLPRKGRGSAATLVPARGGVAQLVRAAES